MPGAPSLQQGVRMARDMDLGADGHWCQNKKGPGDGRSCTVLRCNAHEECGKLLRVVFNKVDGDYIFQEAGAHSQVTKKKARKNVALSLEQEKEAKFGIATGQLKPAGIVLGMTTAMEQEYLKKNVDPLSMKRPGGGLIGKSQPNGQMRGRACAGCLLGVCLLYGSDSRPARRSTEPFVEGLLQQGRCPYILRGCLLIGSTHVRSTARARRQRTASYIARACYLYCTHIHVYYGILCTIFQWYCTSSHNMVTICNTIHTLIYITICMHNILVIL